MINIIDSLVRTILAELTHRLSIVMPICSALFGSWSVQTAKLYIFQVKQKSLVNHQPTVVLKN
jgi:hypothetical protein